MNDQEEKFLITDQDGVRIITLNRPKKKNAFDQSMYPKMDQILKNADMDSSVKVCVLTGSGDSFSSGNDLGNFLDALSSNQFSSKEEMAEFGGKLLHGTVKTLIDFSKPIIAAVNGPAIGIMFTTLPLFDLVFASSTATFLAPFSRLGQAPEGCSTYTFPRLMGTSKAVELLLLGRKIGVNEAKHLGLVNEIFTDNFMKHVIEQAIILAKLPSGSVKEGKRLMSQWNKEELHRVNEEECKVLIKRWQSEECLEAVLEFFQRKGKL